MDFEELRKIDDEQAKNRALYEEIFREKDRLASPAMSVERLTTLRVLRETLKPRSRVLDLGCGAGAYALPLAEAGHEVLAVDPVPLHIAQLKAAIRPGMALEVLQDGAPGALEKFPDGGFDAVLCLGPMYHLHRLEDRLLCLRECARVLRPGGHIFLAFINSDWVVATQTLRYDGGEYLLTGDYDRESFRVDNFPFQFHTLREAEEEVEAAGLHITRRMTSDGLSEMHEQGINAFTGEQFAQWLRYHWHLCEKPEFLGCGNHLLFVCQKEDPGYIMSLRGKLGHRILMQCGASVIAENARGEVLLLRRTDTGDWCYPGGAVELYEQTEAAARRELLEETGLTAGRLTLFGVFSGLEIAFTYPNGDRVSNVDIVYACREFSGNLKAEAGEASELRFFPGDALPENLFPPTAQVLREYVKRKRDEP